MRYIANRSSGRMGIALARAAIDKNWPTTLLLGPTPLPPPQSSHLHTARFQTTADLQALLRQHWPNHDVLFMAAAVADYRTVGQDAIRPHTSDLSAGKIKRSDQPLLLELAPTPDLLAELANLTNPRQVVIGFALEPPDRLLNSAREKLHRKHLDAIVANPIETMESPTISATVLLASGGTISPGQSMTKEKFAAWLMDEVRNLIDQKRATLIRP